MSKLPETLVLFATVHGVIPLTESKEVETFQVPKGMMITRVMATRPGICNMTSEDQINKIIDIMVTEDITKPDYIQNVVAKTQPVNAEIFKDVFKQIKGDSDAEYVRLGKQFIESSITLPSIRTFKHGDIILDKYFARSDEEGRESKTDYKLNMMNVPGKPDLFDVFPLASTEGSTTRFMAQTMGRQVKVSDLIRMLQFQGVRNLILIDYTCSLFDENVAITSREERAIRNKVLKQGRGRKRTRRLKRKTKTRRGKKRTTQWKR